MQVGLAIASILSFFLAFWALHVARHPRRWRRRWLARSAVVELNCPRSLRRSQERQMAASAVLLFVLLVSTSLSCAWWTYDQIRETRQSRASLPGDPQATSARSQ